MNDLSNILGLISVILAIFGIWYAYNSARSLRDDLSTRYIGAFPDHISDIIDEITKARKTIKIVVDSPAYGSFSAPKLFSQYRVALISKCLDEATDIVTKIIINSPKYQIPKDTSQVEHYIAQNPSFRSEYIKFSKLPSDLSDKDVMAHLFKRDSDLVTLLNNQTKSDIFGTLEPNQFPNVMCWIFDDLRAIFVIPNHTDIAEQAFFTREPKLVRALVGIFEEAHKQAKKCNPNEFTHN